VTKSQAVTRHKFVSVMLEHGLLDELLQVDDQLLQALDGLGCAATVVLLLKV
jgi:hypothetical protein